MRMREAGREAAASNGVSVHSASQCELLAGRRWWSARSAAALRALAPGGLLMDVQSPRLRVD